MGRSQFCEGKTLCDWEYTLVIGTLFSTPLKIKPICFGSLKFENMTLCTHSKHAVVDSLTVKTAGRFYLISSSLQLILQPECTLSYPGETEHVGCFPGIPVPGWSRAKYKDASRERLSLVLSRVSSTPLPPMLGQFWKNCLKHKTEKVRIKGKGI